MDKNIELDFLASALNTNIEETSSEDLLKWVDLRRKANYVSVELVKFKNMSKWIFESKTGNLQHISGKFFSIVGINIFTNFGNVSSWSQPIINQPEIGFLGFISKKINGILHFLIQAKIEPGNLNYVQLSPTLQATKSNYQRVHMGKAPLYLEYFNGDKKVKILLDQLQSEQGARFYKKRNRNIIVQVDYDIPIYDDFCWLTLRQIKELLKYDNLINMDSRTVLSGISFGNISNLKEYYILLSQLNSSYQSKYLPFLQSAILVESSLKSMNEIIFWITKLKTKFELYVNKISLKNVDNWIKDDYSIFHKDHKYFSVIAANISVGNREVINWSQPLIKSAQVGLIAFIVKKINNVYHFLVQAKVEAGNLDILELAPTVQCLTGNYRKGFNEYEIPYINDVLNANKENILYSAFQSEEGGRFFQEQNLNMIVEVGDDFNIELVENYNWLTLNQLITFIKFNNYLNIQARSLISVISF
jgi:oxidase EvaA